MDLLSNDNEVANVDTTIVPVDSSNNSSSSVSVPGSRSLLGHSFRSSYHSNQPSGSHFMPFKMADNQDGTKDGQEVDWLYTLLEEEELLQYYDKIKNDLQIKRLAVSTI